MVPVLRAVVNTFATAGEDLEKVPSQMSQKCNSLTPVGL
jgi:hypothetical protein